MIIENNILADRENVFFRHSTMTNEEKTKANVFQIFYSWQSDLPGNVTKSFIETCIKKALKEINKENETSLFAEYTRDTEGKSGSNDITDTIYEKIDESDMFIGDISVVRKKYFWEKGKSFLNPNVLIESGYATHALEKDRVVFVCNTAFGELDKFPFDIRNRKIIKYTLKNKKNPNKVDEEKKKLVGYLKKEIKDIIEKGKNPSRKPQLHDVKLYEKFIKEMPHNKFIHFLEIHDILDYHREDDLDPAYTFLECWTGPDNDFCDPQASALLNIFKDKLKKVCMFLALKTVDVPGGGGLYRVCQKLRDYDEECKKLSSSYYPLADETIKAYTDLVNYGKVKFVV